MRKRGIERYKLLDQEWSIARVRAELDFVQALADELTTGRLTWKDDEDVTTCHPHDPDQRHDTETGVS